MSSQKQAPSPHDAARQPPQNLVTWNKVVTEDKSMHMKDFFADKIGADTSKVLLLIGQPHWTITAVSPCKRSLVSAWISEGKHG